VFDYCLASVKRVHKLRFEL